MTLPNESLAETEKARIGGNIEVVDGKFVFILQAYRDDAELARQLPILGQLFVGGDVSTEEQRDERTDDEKAQQGLTVRNDITQAVQALQSQGVNIGAKLREIYAPFLATPPQLPRNTSQERVGQVFALIGQGKGAIMSQMLGMS